MEGEIEDIRELRQEKGAMQKATREEEPATCLNSGSH